MKLLSFLVPAFAGLAAAQHHAPEAEAYIFRSRQPSGEASAPSLSAPIAEAILQQRLGYANQLAENIPEDEIHHIARYGKTSQRLFAEVATHEPNQLVLLLSNIDKTAMKALKNVLSAQEPAFTTPRFESLPPAPKGQCSIESAVTSDKKCWIGKTLYLEYDVTREPKAVKSLSDNLSKLRSLASSNMETTLILAPVGTTSDKVARRDFFETEAVMTEPSKIQTTSGSSKPASSKNNDQDQSFKPLPFVAKTGSLPACFASKNSCETATSECSGHGACLNKFAAGAETACFACHCQKTHEGNSKSIWYWGGVACQKQDVSVPFWIFVGFTLFMVGAVGFSINLLFNVGEEKLPGVIGAGVSRGSK
ncbi:hypothetical protein BKA67DRAFT_554993 [Truncatella angustata]|uniref:Vacuolar sorting protein Vps3844 C-terminal domain-containing protein n=1 Tax=Truncatella angustata TaxID=152316 RepID=A0A9P9A0J4_9PEZI|nr:uncharacterized protein BKA67DRAFT_554993 [Truncatella angustata]KAH6657333.1 hypothetical protein BKA67DRAFT_554993 [Truncatella angustata]